MSAPIEVVLQSLGSAKPNGPDKWIARCPAHNDKEPSLVIRNSEDGKVLLHCFAGCTITEITAAISLRVNDLFPGDKQSRNGPSKNAIRHEQAVYQIGLAMQAQGVVLSATDQARFDLAKQRLGALK